MTETEMEIPHNNCLKQSMNCAISLAGYAGVELSQQQAKNYAESRSESGYSVMSDQKLLYLFLDSDQKEAFRNRYAHMEFGIIPEQIDTKLISLPLLHQIGEQALVLAQVG